MFSLLRASIVGGAFYQCPWEPAWFSRPCWSLTPVLDPEGTLHAVEAVIGRAIAVSRPPTLNHMAPPGF